MRQPQGLVSRKAAWNTSLTSQKRLTRQRRQRTSTSTPSAPSTPSTPSTPSSSSFFTPFPTLEIYPTYSSSLTPSVLSPRRYCGAQWVNSIYRKPVASVAYQVILEPGIGQFREFEPHRVHTRINSWGLFLVDKLTCGKRESASWQQTFDEQSTSSGTAEPYAR